MKYVLTNMDIGNVYLQICKNCCIICLKIHQGNFLLLYINFSSLDNEIKQTIIKTNNRVATNPNIYYVYNPKVNEMAVFVCKSNLLLLNSNKLKTICYLCFINSYTMFCYCCWTLFWLHVKRWKHLNSYLKDTFFCNR